MTMPNRSQDAEGTDFATTGRPADAPPPASSWTPSGAASAGAAEKVALWPHFPWVGAVLATVGVVFLDQEGAGAFVALVLGAGASLFNAGLSAPP